MRICQVRVRRDLEEVKRSVVFSERLLVHKIVRKTQPAITCVHIFLVYQRARNFVNTYVTHTPSRMTDSQASFALLTLRQATCLDANLFTQSLSLLHPSRTLAYFPVSERNFINTRTALPYNFQSPRPVKS